MRKGIIVSAALHFGVIGATMVVWPSALNRADESPPVVPIDLVTVAELTNIVPTAAEEPPPEPQAPVVPEPVPLVPRVEPQLEVQLAQMEPPPPELEPELEPAPMAETEPTPPRPPQPRAKPEPDRTPRFDVDSVIALLDNRAPRSPAVPTAPVADQSRLGIGAQDAMTLDIQDALLAQMKECWNPPVGAPNPEQLIVGVEVFLAPNGNLAQPPRLNPASRSAAAANAYLRTAAESALRAVNICAPYRGLPPDRYNEWREIDMTFDPTRMAGR